jgi:hypothetical protein
MPEEGSGGGGQPVVNSRAATRPPIEARAAKRDAVLNGRDRYSSLVRALQAGREMELGHGQGRFAQWDWNPIARKLIAAIVIGVVLYFGARAAGDWLRQEAVNTWAGPDATVQSGQKLATCPVAATLPPMEVYPNWVSWGGRVLVRTEFVRPGVIDGERYVDTGYQLGELKLVELRNSDAGRAHTEAMIWSGALAGVVYRTMDGCDTP